MKPTGEGTPVRGAFGLGSSVAFSLLICECSLIGGRLAPVQPSLLHVRRSVLAAFVSASDKNTSCQTCRYTGLSRIKNVAAFDTAGLVSWTGALLARAACTACF